MIVLTLAEKSQFDQPYYTFRLVAKDSKEEVVFCASDVSGTPSVYNKFVVTIANDELRQYGRFNAPSGQYNYFVYENEEPRVLDIERCGRIVEVGILEIVGDEREVKVFEGEVINPTKVWSQQNR